MKTIAAATMSLSLVAMACAPAQNAPATRGPAPEDIRAVSPALERYRQDVLVTDLWQRPDLSPRDRSIVTLAALIARNQAADLPRQVEQALENGVTPAEISEITTHLAFYAGWGNAMAAVELTRAIFLQHGIGADQLPSAAGELLPLDVETEAQRADLVEREWGAVAPGVVHYTEDLLFRELWLRPALAPRDRSLVTVSALIAAGHVEQIPFHLNRAMDNGLTRLQASEMLTHLAFYAGWPNVFSAMPVARDVFQERSN